jgi:aryl-phospho-beta-D-glucosidase BglC (GH1 family)
MSDWLEENGCPRQSDLPLRRVATEMNTRCFNRILASIALLVVLSAAARAQLPTPTYGWNLGNTLEPPSGEGTWGPAATQAIINAVADSGFNTIRLPVAWDSHANQSTHVIDPAWMARVKQVVDWCYAKNLTVIVNCHWDGGWLENNVTDTVNPTINAKMQSYWTQIATTFAAYDNRLLFAGANEPNCDTAAEWVTLRSYYNTFIGAVRATGGNNATRWLVIQGPNTNIDLTYDLVTTLPTDSATGRLAVEVHYYPWRWTLMAEDAWWGKMFYFWGQGYHSPTMLDRNSTAEEEAYADEQFQKMATKFVSQGVPVILGEWGAMKRTGYPDLTGTELDRHLASRTYYSKYITDKANALGLKPIWWDAGGTGSNTMWLFDRSTAAVIDPDNLRALTGGAALPPPGGGGNSGTAHLVNVSIRATAGTGANTLIAGFVLSGSGAKSILLRGIGPTLADLGVGSPLADPSIMLYNAGGTVLGSNNDWGGASTLSTTFARLGAFSLAASSKDAALLTPLTAGGRTMHVTTSNSTSGAALAEVYDGDTSSTDLQLVNISGRGAVDASSNLIAGFVVSGTGSMNVLVRAVGPTLTDLGVTGVLSNPNVTIYNSSGASFASNDDWGGSTALSSTFTQVGAFNLPASSKDAAILLTLTPGAYTAVVSGINGATGVALVEVYAVQ